MDAAAGSDDEMQEVFLHVYDLTNGMARVMAPMILGIDLDGIWHTGVVVFGKECMVALRGIL